MKNVEDYKLLMVGNWRLRSAKENFLEKLKEEKMDDKVILRKEFQKASYTVCMKRASSV